MHAERLAAQLLSGPPATDPLAVVERLLAVQGQDPRGARLAIRSRSAGLTAGDVDRALTEDRSLVIDWTCRGTLHLVRSEDHAWLHALTTPPLHTGNARRLAQEGVSPAAAERGVAIIERALGDGPQTRGRLREVLDAAGVPTAGQALVHLLMLACLRGIAVRGPLEGKDHAFVLVRDWLGERAPVDCHRALAELARRYLAGHGPATDRDLARWAGIGLRDARAGLQAIAPELDDCGEGRMALRAARRPGVPLPPPRLLGPFDPVLLGWTSRDDVVGRHRELVTANGLFRPFAMAGGRAVAVWRMPAGRVELEPLKRLSPAVRSALQEDAADVERFMASYGSA